jgi:ubiquinone/menaquinone biosynthesis C-methylase UbiE
MDWDRGSYEETAKELFPAAEHVVQSAGIEEHHEVLDLGTGTGNAALLAARAGANVTAIDPSPRLLGVAQERVGEGRFEVAAAEDLPFDDQSFDRVLSVFAVIFSQDPPKAAQEIERVLKPTGKALITAWEPQGGLNDALRIIGTATAEASGNRRNRFAWGDPGAVRPLFTRTTVDVERAAIPFAAASAEDYLSAFESRHPAGILFKDVLTQAGTYEETRARAKQALEADTPTEVGYFIYTISSPRTAA